MNFSTSSSDAYNFLFDNGIDHLGWSRDDYLNATDFQWEENHDMIQWLFPTWEPSRFNPYAPVVSKELLQVWGSDQQNRNNVLENVQRFLSFLGLHLDIDELHIHIKDGSQWNIQNWLPQPTHNDLRITRVLEHLHAINLQAEAKYVYLTLLNLVESHRSKIDSVTLEFWKCAAFGLTKPELPSKWNTTFLVDDLDNLI